MAIGQKGARQFFDSLTGDPEEFKKQYGVDPNSAEGRQLAGMASTAAGFTTEQQMKTLRAGRDIAALTQAQATTGARGSLAGGQIAAGQAATSAARMAGEEAFREQKEVEQRAAQQTLEESLVGLENRKAASDLERERLNFMRRQQDDQDSMNTMSTVLNVLSTTATLVGLFTASDERIKTNREPANAAAYRFLEELAPEKYDIPRLGTEGEFSVMAQDLEKSEMGRQTVNETPDGVKTIDIAGGLKALLASQAALHERLKKLEG